MKNRELLKNLIKFAIFNYHYYFKANILLNDPLAIEYYIKIAYNLSISDYIKLQKFIPFIFRPPITITYNNEFINFQKKIKIIKEELKQINKNKNYNSDIHLFSLTEEKLIPLTKYKIKTINLENLETLLSTLNYKKDTIYLIKLTDLYYVFNNFYDECINEIIRTKKVTSDYINDIVDNIFPIIEKYLDNLQDFNIGLVLAIIPNIAELQKKNFQEIISYIKTINKLSSNSFLEQFIGFIEKYKDNIMQHNKDLYNQAINYINDNISKELWISNPFATVNTVDIYRDQILQTLNELQLTNYLENIDENLYNVNCPTKPMHLTTLLNKLAAKDNDQLFTFFKFKINNINSKDLIISHFIITKYINNVFNI